MTREEAIKILSYRDANGVPCGYAGGITEALDMAIKALEQEPCEDISPTAIPVTLKEAKRLLHTEWKKEVTKDKSNDRLLVAYQMAIKALEQEPSGDNETWECARKISAMTMDECEKVFGEYRYLATILQNFTASEAIAKIKAYEEG